MSDIWSWAIFAVLLGIFLAIDLFMVQRRAGPLSLRSAFAWVAVWVTLGLGFAIFVWQTRGAEAAGLYLAGYLIEYSLSADNVFVFAMLFAYFAVPAEHQRRLLFWGVLGAIVLRAVFILGGIALIAIFEPVIYVFGALLVITGIKMARTVDEGMDPEANAVLRVVRRRLPVTPGYVGRAFFVRQGGRLLATPLFAALVAVELSDVMFAIDSVPAILAITTDPFLVLTSNGFAILGLRSLYFVLAGMLDRFVYLKIGLGAILVFAGAKMLLSSWVHLPAFVSLAVIAGILSIALVASLLATRRHGDVQAAQGDEQRR
ncbi:MAG: TerC family protein [Chloroflexota bacterium]|nr:TerC family protein [Chloroflexota bacterium]